MDELRNGPPPESGRSNPNATLGMSTNAGNSLNFFSDSIVAFAKCGDIFCLGGSSEIEPRAFVRPGSHSGCRYSRLSDSSRQGETIRSYCRFDYSFMDWSKVT
jgi:hypothetical protein